MHAKTAAQNACWARSAHMRARTAACWWEVMRCAFRCWFVAFAVVFASPLCSVRVQGPADRLLHSVPNSEICFDTTCVHLSFEIFNRSIAENSYSNQAFDLCRKTESEFNTWRNPVNGFLAMFVRHCPALCFPRLLFRIVRRPKTHRKLTVSCEERKKFEKGLLLGLPASHSQRFLFFGINRTSFPVKQTLHTPPQLSSVPFFSSTSIVSSLSVRS